MRSRIRRVVHHSLLIGGRELKAMEQLLLRNYEKVTIHTDNLDGTRLEVDTIDELLQFDNLNTRRIKRVNLGASVDPGSDNPRRGDLAVLVIGSDARETAGYDVESADDQAAVAIAAQITDLLREAKPWYSALTKIHATLLLGIALAIPFIVISFAIKSGHYELPEASTVATPWWVLLYTNLAAAVAIAGIGEALNRCMKFIFPRTFFLIGKQEDRYKRIQGIRRLIFGGIVLAILVTVAGNLLTDYIRQ